MKTHRSSLEKHSPQIYLIDCYRINPRTLSTCGLPAQFVEMEPFERILWLWIAIHSTYPSTLDTLEEVLGIAKALSQEICQALEHQELIQLVELEFFDQENFPVIVTPYQFSDHPYDQQLLWLYTFHIGFLPSYGVSPLFQSIFENYEDSLEQLIQKCFLEKDSSQKFYIPKLGIESKSNRRSHDQIMEEALQARIFPFADQENTLKENAPEYIFKLPGDPFSSGR